MKLFITVVFLSVISSFYGQPKMESWYNLDIEDLEGYFHVLVEETPNALLSTFEIKIKVDGEIISYTTEVNSKKDLYLTVNSFTTKNIRNTNSKMHENVTTGKVTKVGDDLKWIIDQENITHEKSIMETKQPTVIDWDLFYILTQLDYSKKGRILDFNSMEISELNYKEDHHLDYIGDETITIKGKKILVKKVTHNGGRIGESTYWIDAHNNLVKASIDNRKHFIKCTKEEIDFSPFKD